MTKMISCGLVALLLGGCLGGCLGGSRSPSPATDGTGRSEVEETALRPTVRKIEGADIPLLWKAAHDYMAALFPLDVDNPAKRSVETHTLEWEADRNVFRTRITVQVIPDPETTADARLGVLARIIRPRWFLENASEGSPLKGDWALVGNHQQMENFVAGKILERYLLLRQGKDPEVFQKLVPPKELEKSKKKG